MCALNQAGQIRVREYVRQYIDVPDENIFMGATHTHSAPSINVSKEWDQLLMDSFVKAGKAAMEDLAPVQLQATTATLENMNFVRHYLMNDGTYYGSNFGSDASGYIGNKASYEYRSYETDTGAFASGTGEKLAEEYVKLLNQLK